MAPIEVRDDHYETEKLDTCRVWAAEAGSFLRDCWDMSGFWVDSGEPARISGSAPMDLPVGRPTSPGHFADRPSRRGSVIGLQLSTRFLDEV